MGRRGAVRGLRRAEAPLGPAFDRDVVEVEGAVAVRGHRAERDLVGVSPARRVVAGIDLGIVVDPDLKSATGVADVFNYYTEPGFFGHIVSEVSPCIGTIVINL